VVKWKSIIPYTERKVPEAHKRRILNFDTLLEQDKNQKSEKEARSPEPRQNARTVTNITNNGTGQLKIALITHSIWTNQISDSCPQEFIKPATGGDIHSARIFNRNES
jgi:hypothetical protein